MKYPAVIYKNKKAPDGIEMDIPKALAELAINGRGPALHVLIEEEPLPEFHTANELLHHIEDVKPNNELADAIEEANLPRNNIYFERVGKKFKCSCGLVYASLLNLGRHYENKHLEKEE